MLASGQSFDLAENIRVKRCRHGNMMYFTTDAYVGRSLDLYGEFSEIESNMLSQIVKPGMKVIEIGANIGSHTIALANMVGLSGAVLAFEPQRELFQVLNANLAMNSISNVWTRCEAVGAERGQTTMPMIDYTKPGNFGGVSAGAGDRIIPVVTLDSDPAVQGGVHVIKIDVEGMELDVLRGAKKFIGTHRPLLYVENDRPEKSPALIEFLLEQKYRCYWDLPPLFSEDNFFGNRTNVFENIVSANMLCIPAELAIEMRNFTEIKRPVASYRDHAQD